MTYNENPELVKTVLEAELERQRRALEWSRSRLNLVNDEIRPLMEKRMEAETEIGAATALIEGLEKTLGKVAPEIDAFTGEVEEPAEEDPYDVAFAKTDTVEPSKTETFGRAPLMGEPGF